MIKNINYIMICWCANTYLHKCVVTKKKKSITLEGVKRKKKRFGGLEGCLVRIRRQNGQYNMSLKVHTDTCK